MPSRLPVSAVLACLTLTGCFSSPEIEALSAVAPVDAPYPELAPASALPPPATDPDRGLREADDLERRAAALRARADALGTRRP